ncbi:hypothetical protein HDV62DRAFT_276143 [Trichoderma sp. SZMC 28011]
MKLTLTLWILWQSRILDSLERVSGSPLATTRARGISIFLLNRGSFVCPNSLNVPFNYPDSTLYVLKTVSSSGKPVASIAKATIPQTNAL